MAITRQAMSSKGRILRIKDMVTPPKEYRNERIWEILHYCNIEKGNLQRLWKIFLKKGAARARCQESAKKAVLEQGRFDFDGPRWYNEDRFAAMRTGKEKQQKYQS